MLTLYLIGVAVVLAAMPFALKLSNIKATFGMILACLAAALLSWLTIAIVAYKAYDKWRNFNQ
jgi:hypothetical protein